MRGFFNEFREFALKGSVIDLAVGLIIGVAFGALVNSLVNDIIMPPIGYALNGVDFSNLFITLSDGNYSSLAEAQEAGAATINYGLFLNQFINFVVVAIAVFFLVKAINTARRKLEREQEAEEAAADPTTDEKLLAVLERLDSKLEGGGKPTLGP